MSGKRAADWIQSFGHQPVEAGRVRTEFGRQLRKIYSGIARAPLPGRILELALQVDHPRAQPLGPSSDGGTLGPAYNVRKRSS